MLRLPPRTALVAVLATALALSARPATAQEGLGASAEDLRSALIGDFERHRQMDIAFARAIPDSALRWAPTEGVRDFAQQIEHITGANTMFVAGAVLGTDAPSLGDPETYLNDKEALVRMVGEAYDYALQSLRELPAERFVADTELFGQSLPRWRVYSLALAHADWTRGQLVPYFRLHGVDPPDWALF